MFKLFRRKKKSVDVNDDVHVGQPIVDHLPALRDRTRRGAAGEAYVSKILDEFRKQGCLVDRGLIVGKDIAGEHFGDIDFFIEYPPKGVSVVIEVKTSDPWMPVSDPRFRLRGTHHWQAARNALGIYRLSAGTKLPVPIVVYVDPLSSDGRLLLNLPPRTEEMPESCYPSYPVSSVGAANLRRMLWAILLDDNGKYTWPRV